MMVPGGQPGENIFEAWFRGRKVREFEARVRDRPRTSSISSRSPTSRTSRRATFRAVRRSWSNSAVR